MHDFIIYLNFKEVYITSLRYQWRHNIQHLLHINKLIDNVKRFLRYNGIRLIDKAAYIEQIYITD